MRESMGFIVVQLIGKTDNIRQLYPATLSRNRNDLRAAALTIKATAGNDRVIIAPVWVEVPNSEDVV
jgi:hypothetical protein